MLKKNKIIIGITCTAVVIIIAVTLGVTLSKKNKKDSESGTTIITTLTTQSATNESTTVTELPIRESFGVDATKNVFLLNDKEFQYVAGSMHYFRSTPESWRAKLRVMRSAGLNALDTYVYWALHNPHDGVYNFEGIANVIQFIEIAQEEGFYIILRPGPYICAEIDNGGLPHWLLTKYANLKARTSDQNYLNEVRKWYYVLMPKFVKYLIGNGGKIIMVQVENEYGIFGACDQEYMEWLTLETKKYVDDSVILFTTDIPVGDVNCGHKLDGVYRTIDFGAEDSDEKLADLWNTMRKIQPTGPYVNSEYYPGWLTYWQEDNQRRDGELIANVLRKMLAAGASVNFYMMHGGTNFGFTSGANNYGVGLYKSDITSYDYDAPLDEAGDPTVKLHKIRDVIVEFLPPPPYDIPVRSPKMSLPDVIFKPGAGLLSQTSKTALGGSAITDTKPKTFEQLDQFSGYVLYETMLPEINIDPTQLIVNGVRDRGQVFIDGFFVGTVSRGNAINTIPINKGIGSKLQILVENQGRINYAITDDIKGILGTVSLQLYDGMLHEFNEWTTIGFPFDNYTKVEKAINNNVEPISIHKTGVLFDGPIIFDCEFDITDDNIYDTWIDPTGWSKGIIFVNGFNIGRYWPIVGPQITMYLPKDLLKQGKNRIIVVELQQAEPSLTIKFVNAPIWRE